MKAPVTLMALLLLGACNKGDSSQPKPAPATLAAEWYGLYSNSLTTQPSMPFYMNIRSNGTMKIAGYDTSQYYTADTAYTLKGADSLMCTYVYKYKNGSPGSKYSIACKYLPNFSFISGTWGYGNNAYNGGYFYLGRKP
ncbi:MAG: hypothetical protein KJS92_08695 [Bacteroidetes bacterium]|nr:hypothetical protein [Bacteroidota bacterium]